MVYINIPTIMLQNWLRRSGVRTPLTVAIQNALAASVNLMNWKDWESFNGNYIALLLAVHSEKGRASIGSIFRGAEVVNQLESLMFTRFLIDFLKAIKPTGRQSSKNLRMVGLLSMAMEQQLTSSQSMKVQIFLIPNSSLLVCI